MQTRTLGNLQCYLTTSMVPYILRRKRKRKKEEEEEEEGTELKRWRMKWIVAAQRAKSVNAFDTLQLKNRTSVVMWGFNASTVGVQCHKHLVTGWHFTWLWFVSDGSTQKHELPGHRTTRVQLMTSRHAVLFFFFFNLTVRYPAPFLSKH